MKIYKIKVNGKVYQVELESVEQSDQHIIHDKIIANPSVSAGETVNSPMQGTIQKVFIKPGQVVKKGDSLLVLEAMKLENDITAEKDFTVKSILVNIGETVNHDQPLIEVIYS